MNARRLMVAFACCLAGLSAGMILLGLLCTGILAHTGPLSAEDHVDVFLAAHRVPSLSTVTDALCLLAGTYGAALVAVVMVIWARLHYKRGAEPLCIAFAILAVVHQVSCGGRRVEVSTHRVSASLLPARVMYMRMAWPGDRTPVEAQCAVPGRIGG